jgi:hypothetical protein
VRFKFILFLFLFSGFWNLSLQAQIRPTIPQTGNPTGFPPQQNQEENQEQKEESQGRKKLIDDSTKMVFGPKTSLYFLEKDVKRNRITKIEGDTSLYNFHYFEPVAKSRWMYQDLGNVGSAAKPIFYQLPSVIGTTSGFEAYDQYYYGPDSMRYFDTKSPYTQMNAFFGGGNRNMLDLVFARNVNPRWNIGFNFKTIRARKTLNPNARDDNMAEQNAYALHTNYKSENGKYFLLGSFSRMRHLVNEQGGIISPDVDSTSLLFAYEDAKVWLRESQAIDLRQDYHLYHEYDLVKGWQLYHVFDRRKQDVSFQSDLTTSDSAFFNIFSPERLINRDSSYNRNQFTDWRNEVGFKGDIGPLYYNAFVKFRNGRVVSPNFEGPKAFNEFFIGGALRGDISEKWRFEAEGEYLLPEAFRIKGTFVSPYLEATYTKALYKPTAMQQFYRGNHHKWENDFDNIGVDQIQGVLKADFKSLTFRPNVTLNRVNNYVFIDKDQRAAQATGEAFMVIPGLKFSVNLNKKLFLEGEGYYTLITGDGKDNFRIPEVLVNSRLFYESPMFDENIFVQIGLEGRYRSDNLADFYNPALQQFHIQNVFNVFAYPVVDFFLNARINRTRVLLRMNHINMNMMSQPGYFITPYFTGLRRTLDIGISWPLFD